jgi:hypothetical protein
MTPEETAPPFESWPEHLKSLGDRELRQLAGDYRWLDDEARLREERPEFHKRREKMIAECERRGMRDAAEACRPKAQPRK